MKKTLTVGAALAVLGSIAIPAAAFAGAETPPVSTCQKIPVATPGVSILGQRVPGATDLSVCIASHTVVEAIPTIIDQAECGSPCFSVEIDGLQVSEKVGISVRFKLDGQEEDISFSPDTVSVDPGDDSSLCVMGVGSPDPCTDRVTTPRNLSASAKGPRNGSRVDLAWAASKATRRATVVGYQIWRSATGEPGSFEQIGASTGTAYVDSTVTRGLRYWYYVIAWDDGGRYSPASNTADATAR